MRYTDRLVDAGIAPSVGSQGDAYDCEHDGVGGNSKFPIRGNRKPHTLVVGGLCPAFHDVGESNSEGAGGKCTDGRRGCC